MKRPLSVKEAAAFLGTTRQQVRKLIHSGDLPSIKLGREFRIPAESMEKYLSPSGIDIAYSKQMKLHD